MHLESVRGNTGVGRRVEAANNLLLYFDCILEQEFIILSSEADNQERHHVMNRAQAIKALLASDTLINMALESWKNLVDRQANTGTVTTRIKREGRLIPDFIQVLFDLLPTLRVALQTYCICLAEAEDRTKNKSRAATSSGNETPFDQIQSQLSVVGEILSKREKLAQEKGQNVKSYSPIFKRRESGCNNSKPLKTLQRARSKSR